MAVCRKFDKAWQHLQQANDLQHSKAGFDASHDATLLKVGHFAAVVMCSPALSASAWLYLWQIQCSVFDLTGVWTLPDGPSVCWFVVSKWLLHHTDRYRHLLAATLYRELKAVCTSADT